MFYYLAFPLAYLLYIVLLEIDSDFATSHAEADYSVCLKLIDGIQIRWE